MKFLGIHITETLKWNAHVQSLASKLSTVSFMIKSLKEILSTNIIQNLISSFRRVQNVVCFLLGDSPASDLYIPTFRNTLSVLSSKAFEDGTDSVPKRRHI